jgi:hypothetical protein
MGQQLAAVALITILCLEPLPHSQDHIIQVKDHQWNQKEEEELKEEKPEEAKGLKEVRKVENLEEVEGDK